LELLGRGLLQRPAQTIVPTQSHRSASSWHASSIKACGF
jgi:hypothetical protein